MGPGGWGWMEKSRFPPKPGEGAGKGVSINFRPQACSLPRRRLGSRVGDIPAGDPLRTSSGQPRDPAQCLTPRCYASRPPPLFGKPRGGVCLLLARTAGLANPWEEVPYDIHPEGQSALTVLLRRQSSRGGSGAVAWPGEGGRSCQRSRLQPPPLLGTRARPDPSSLGRLRGARAVGVPGPRTPGPRLGRPRIASLPGVRVGREPAAASRGRHWSGGARRRAPGSKNSPARSPRFLQPSGGKVQGAGAGSVPRASGSGPACSWAVSLPAPPGPLVTPSPICLFPRILPGLAE